MSMLIHNSIMRLIAGTSVDGPQLVLLISYLLILLSVSHHSLKWKFHPNPGRTTDNSFGSSGDFVFKLSVILGKTCTRNNHTCEYRPCGQPSALLSWDPGNSDYGKNDFNVYYHAGERQTMSAVRLLATTTITDPPTTRDRYLALLHGRVTP